MADNGAITPLLLMLYSQDHTTIEASLLALLSLASRSERNKFRIVKSGAIPLLLNLLRYKIETIIDLTIAALLVLSSCSANKPAVAASGAIQRLLQTVNSRRGIISDQAKLDTIAILHNLSTCNGVIPLLVSSGIVPFLLRLINNSGTSSDSAEKAMAMLDRVVSLKHPMLIEVTVQQVVVRVMVEAVEEGTQWCKEHAASILLEMCQSCRERYRGLILKEGAMPGLLQLSMDGTRRGKGIATELLSILRDYTGSKKKGIKIEVIEKIMGEIDGIGGVADGGKVGMTLRLVEEMIATLS